MRFVLVRGRTPFRKHIELPAISRSQRAVCEISEHGYAIVILIAAPQRDRTALVAASSYHPRPAHSRAPCCTRPPFRESIAFPRFAAATDCGGPEPIIWPRPHRYSRFYPHFDSVRKDGGSSL
jgi:hypothetical protein